MSHPYMPLFVSDYLGDTSHLTTIEHGAYMLLIMTYWQRGKALPADSQRLANITRLSLDQWREIEPTIAELFSATDDAWTHPRIEKELARAREKSAKARASAERRHNGRAADDERTQCEGTANAQRTQCFSDSDLDIDKITASSSTEQEPARAEQAEARKQVFKFDRKGLGARAKPAGKDRIAELRLHAEGFGINVAAHWQTIERKAPENPYGYLRKLCVKDLRAWMPTAGDEVLQAALKGESEAKKLVFQAMMAGGSA